MTYKENKMLMARLRYALQKLFAGAAIRQNTKTFSFVVVGVHCDEAQTKAQLLYKMLAFYGEDLPYFRLSVTNVTSLTNTKSIRVSL
jgi:hypothetical protein